MKDDEAKKIVEALTSCSVGGACRACSYNDRIADSESCCGILSKDAADLIELQMAEIDTLRTRIADMSKAMMYNARQCALPREYGHWCYTDAYPHHMYCSECHKTFVPNREWVDEGHIPYPEHCPHCGAKMEM